MHVPQSEQSRIELRELAAVPTQIISPSTHKPIISIVQDTLVGSYLFTRYDNYLTREEVLDVMIDVSTFDGTLPEPEVKAGTKDKDLPVDFPKYKYNTKVDLWSGRQLFSMIIPPINLNKKNSSYDNDSREINNVVIKNGKVISGVFDSTILGQSEGSLIHIVFHKYGFERTQQLLDDIQNIVTNWVLKSGFSVGIGDLIPDKNTENKIKNIIDINKKKVIEIISHVHQNILENKTGKSNNEEFEQQVKKELQELTDLTGKDAVKNLRSDNRMMSMIVSGSKGKPLNISQMMACVGQQDVDGKRIQYGFTDRTLPHFHKFDDGASARGFVENSFMKGLTPTEFFFHAMGGREGLIDTAVKTSETGYIQRKLVKCMEDARVATDYTVRNANGTIIQFLYGEDGFDGTKIEKQTITTVNLSNAQIYEKFKLDIDEDINNKYIPDIADDILKNKDIIDQQIQKHIDKLLIDRDFYFNDIFKGNFNENTVFAPVNLNRLVDDAISNFPLHTNLSDLHPSYILNKLVDLDENLKITDSHKGNEIIMVLANIYLSPKPLLDKKISKIAFDYVIAYLTQMFYAAIAHPGELVGTVSAQSMGEPTTQMTLNSVDWDTEIIIAKNGNIITPKIGEFIDNYYENTDRTKVSFMENEQIYIPLEDGNDWKALSTDDDGNMIWTKLEAITRHPVINKDGTDTILQVTLESGRVIKATKAKSFLIYKNDKIEGIDGENLKKGDLIPIANSLNIESLPIIDKLDVSYLLPKTEYIYGCEVKKALEVMHASDLIGKKRPWWKHNQGVLFTLPYSRSDAFREAFTKGHNSNASNIKENCVYPFHMRPDTCHIPYNIQLDEEFGFFCGAYVSEGMCNDAHVSISNNDIKFRDRLKKFADTWNLTYHETIEHDKNGVIGNTSCSVIFHSIILPKILGSLFGCVSYIKRIPDFIYQAPDCFVKAFIDGYMSGDGTIGKNSNKIDKIACTSVSKELIIGLSMIFSRYNINGTIKERPPTKKQLARFKSVSKSYNLYLLVESRIKYANTFKFTIDYKQKRLEKLAEIYKNKNAYKKDKYRIFNNVFLDTVKSIEEIKPMEKWVYDLTVEKTRNFTGKDQCCLKDTFHTAGSGSKGTQGVPRIKELLSVTSNMKKPMNKIILKEPYCYNKEYSLKIMNELSITTIKNLTISSEIYFDTQTIISDSSELPEDKAILDIYKVFNELDTPIATNMVKSPWVLRFKLDKMKLLEKGLRMSDIYFAIISRFNTDNQDISCVFSDDNSTNLILRIQCITDKVEEADCDQEDMICILKTLEKTILNDIVLNGIKGIESAYPIPDDNFSKFDNETKEFVKKRRWTIETDGSNLEDIFAHPAIDAYNSYSNNINEIFEVLGLEAARQALFDEIYNTFGNAGSYVNSRHINLLVDIMTNRGYLMSVDRHGINKGDRGPLAKCSFEETPDIINRAAIFGELDKLKSVSSNIMLGQEVPIGTGSIDLLFDEERYFETLATIQEETDTSNLENIEELGEKESFTSKYCEALF